jgi:hypothetical protein
MLHAIECKSLWVVVDTAIYGAVVALRSVVERSTVVSVVVSYLI